MTIRYLPESDIPRLIQTVDVMTAVRDALVLHAAGGTTLPVESHLAWWNRHGDATRSLSMPAYLGPPVHAVGMKLINASLGNRRRGLRRASGLIVLFDAETAEPTAILEGATISATRTACVSALTASLLGDPRFESLSLLGAGRLAAAHLEVFLASFEHIREVYVFDIDPSQVAALESAFADILKTKHCRLYPTSTAAEVVNHGQITIAATTAQQSYLDLGWARRGAVVINVSLDDVIASSFLDADLLVVDDWAVVRADPHRQLGRLAADGRVVGPGTPLSSDEAARCRAVDAEIGDLLRGLSFPGSRDGIALVNPFGLAVEDVMVAHRVWEAAHRIGLGIELHQ